MTFSEEIHERAREIIARYPAGRHRSALLPLLHLVQSEEGYVSPAGVAFCAEVLGVTKAEVAAVATFYTMYKRKPTGDWLISVCTNTMCGALGGQAAYDALSEYLGVGHDGTTEDGTITLEHAECLAACDYAPVMTVNYEYFDQVTPDSAVRVAKRLATGERPMPTRGARLCTLREMSRQLAGNPDDRAEAVADGAPGDPTLQGNRLAAHHGISVPGFDPDTPIGRADAGPATGNGRAPKSAAKPAAPKPATTAESAPSPVPVPESSKPAVDGKPAGDAPMPQKEVTK